MNAEFIFWPRYTDYTEPDLVLIVGTYYLLIEAKFHSNFAGKNDKETSQLMREIRGGSLEARNLGKEFRLVALTADYVYRTEEFTHVESELNDINFKWISWQQICNYLLEILEEKDLP